MTWGRASEVLFLLLLPFAFRSLGVKKILIIGLLAWIVRFLFFGYGTPDSAWMLYAAILLHGVCYDFFFVTGYMYTEKKAGPQIKNAAQGLFTVATYGVGMFIGTWFSGVVVDKYVVAPDQHNWTSIWYVPAAIAAAVLVYFLIFFKEKKQAAAA